ncbi:TolC family protein [Gammaproteobacteria bacterium]
MASAQASSDFPLGEVLGQALRFNVSLLLGQQQIMAAEGEVLKAQGAFDPVLRASAGRSRDLRPLRADEMNIYQTLGSDPGANQIQEATSYRIGADKTLMNGLTTGLDFTVTSTRDNLQSVTGVPSQLSGTLAFILKVPLARNAGRETVGAELDAVQAEREAARADFQHASAQILLESTLAYWDWVTKAKRLEITMATEKRLEDLVTEIRHLIEADQMPRADIELALASRSEKAAMRLTSEQDVDEARKNLARLMGLAAGRMGELGRPANDFPPHHALPSPLRESLLIDQALASRADLEADRQRDRAAGYRLKAARNHLKPQVDLNLSLGYTGLDEGGSSIRADRSLKNAAGPTVGATLSLQWPWENSAARGAHLAAAAASESAALRQRDLEQSIAANVPVLVALVRRAAAQALESAETVRHYETTLKNEQTKRRLGTATVIDVINVEDRLNNALLADVALRQRYANALTQLRFELGRLVRREGERYQVALTALLQGQAIGD